MALLFKIHHNVFIALLWPFDLFDSGNKYCYFKLYYIVDCQEWLLNLMFRS